MIELYGKKYARNNKEAVESLFNPGGTVNGTYKRCKHGVILMDLQGKERVYIRADGVGPVSVHRTESGRRRYLFACTSSDEAWLGLPASLQARRDGALELTRQLLTK